MDLVTDSQQHRLAALERVATADPVETADRSRELAVTATRLLGGLASLGLCAMIIVGVLWLLV